MSRPTNLPDVGVVFDYWYLWDREAKAGETEGRKPRTACVAVSVRSADGEHHAMIVPITSTEPRAGQHGIRVPDTERARAGLTAHDRAWVMVDEFNYDVAERSFTLEPKPNVYGNFSAAFLGVIAKALLENFRAQAALKVNRL